MNLSDRGLIAHLLLTVMMFWCGAKISAAENWPQWRGPEGNGISDATGLPVTWSLEENIAWKVELPAWSGSTPAIWGDQLFVASPSKSEGVSQQGPPPEESRRGRRGGGRRRGFGGRDYGRPNDPGGQTLMLLCLSKTDGRLIWQHALDEGNRVMQKQNSSSPSPVTDGQHVWAVTGNGAVTALTMDGQEVWKRNLQDDYGQFGLNWGYASSPLLHEGKLIIEVLHGMNTDDPSYVVALDATTGETIWRQERWTDAVSESPDAYTTPALLTHDGTTTIVVSGGDYVTAHNPATGAEVWRAAGLNPQRNRNFRIVASPVVADGMVYAPTRNRPLLALRAGGTGDVSTSHLAWKWERDAGPDVPTPVCDGQYFYMVDDRGRVTCLDAKTGSAVYTAQRTVEGTVSASPLLADGKLYILNESAVATVVHAGPEFKQLATNELDGTYTLASFAVSGQQLFVRTSTHLYCIGG